MFDGITNKGSEYLAKCQATGEGIKLVKVKIGDGRLLDSEDPTTFTDIKSIKKEVEVSEKTQIESNLRLVIEFNNEGVTTGYFPREIGIYALDGETEILYWYINDGDQTTWMPPAEKAPVKYKYGVNIMATNNETTLVNWTGKELWVDKEFLNKELEKKQDVNDNRLLTTVKTIWGAINELFNNKLEKGGYTGTAQNLLTEIAKKASKTTLGRIIVGNGLNVDGDGRISVAAHTHGANEVIEDSSHRMVTDAEKAAWNGKLNQGTVPNSLNSAEKIVAALQGSGGLKFDPNVLHIGDAGTKRVGYYYLDKLKDGIFECLEETTTTINDSSKFRDISNKASADRLDNLGENLGSFSKIIFGSLSNSKESERLPVGHYIVIGSHTGGTITQNLIGLFTISSYDNIEHDKWINIEPLAPYMSNALNDNSYRLQFNPYRRRIRNTTANAKFYWAFYLGS